MTTAVEPSSHTIELRGLRLHYLDWGPELAGEAALPLVLLHGLGGAAGEWRRVAGHFQPRYVLDAETLQRMDMAIEPARSIGLEQSGPTPSSTWRRSSWPSPASSSRRTATERDAEDHGLAAKHAGRPGLR